MTLQDEVDDFVKRSGVDDRAAATLRREDERVQRAVLERGDMADVRNPSAILMSRIRVAKGGGRSRSVSRSKSPDVGRRRGGGGGGGGFPTMDEIDDFCDDNNLDDRAAQQLKEASGLVQQIVLDRGGLTDCRNPSAVCLARIRDAKAKEGKPSSSSGARFSGGGGGGGGRGRNRSRSRGRGPARREGSPP
mmetsp:Transcript_32594/g.69920  ORF Transcript_32594/g.69920 Transcript_32594/m.69920 type:complete len:191 (-) Transcript_32594:553-1125(-)